MDVDADTFLLENKDDRNEGAASVIRVAKKRRGLMAFLTADVEDVLDGGAFVSAELRLQISDNDDKWGPDGRTVDLHRMTVAWAEGNAARDGLPGPERIDGDGDGATWNCAVDSDISDNNKDCDGAQEWDMDGPAFPFEDAPSDTITVADGDSGQVALDLSDDVQGFLDADFDNYGWLVKKTNESKKGKADFASREHDALAGPVLAIIYTPLDGVCDTPPGGGGGGGGGGGRPGIAPGEPGPQGDGGGNQISISPTDVGETYMYADDWDEDGFEDDFDNCMFRWNPQQDDQDGDSRGDLCDLCPRHFNPDQLDGDSDGLGDRCDGDSDNDGVANAVDNCPVTSNAGQSDVDGDSMGDACDDDDDDDGFPDLEDRCPRVATERNLHPRFIEGIGPEDCNSDIDLDGVLDTRDNCPAIPNFDQDDLDGDGVGDGCDGDLDGDAVPNSLDNCGATANAEQDDSDRDGVGDPCDPAFCFVVDTRRPDHCLHPEAPFRVSAGPDLQVPTGQEIRLRLFANRQNAAMRYAWHVAESPAGSGAVARRAAGAVVGSDLFEYHYPDGLPATFRPDQPGRYRIVVGADLAYPDAQGRSSAAAERIIVAVGDPVDSGGCAVALTPGDTRTSDGLGALALVGLFGLLRRRRHP